MTTWNRNFRTAAGIGPCSTIAEMKQAYGEAVQPSWGGTCATEAVRRGWSVRTCCSRLEGQQDDHRGGALPGIEDGHAA